MRQRKVSVSTRRAAQVVLLICLALAECSFADSRRESWPDDIAAQVRIIPSDHRITLDQVYPVSPEDGKDSVLSSPNGSFALSVESPFPGWRVLSTASEIRGPGGEFSPSKVWVQARPGSRPFASLKNEVVLVDDSLMEPTYEVTIDVAVSPAWSDVAGSYEGALALSPVMPDAEEGQVLAAGQPQEVEIGFEIPEVIQLDVTTEDITFSKIEGPGRYAADEDLVFRVATNASHWRIVANGSDLSGPQANKLDASRVHWKLFSPASTDDEIASGDLGKEITVYSGTAPTESLDFRLAFEVEIELSDHAGEYSAGLNLSGEVLGTTEQR